MTKLYWTLREIARENRLDVSKIRYWCDYFGWALKKDRFGYGQKRLVNHEERIKLRRVKKLYRTNFYTLKGIAYYL